MNPRFKQTTKLFQKLPGVGPRQAARFVLALLEKDEEELRDLGQAIISLKRDLKLCKECFNLSDNGLCHICSDQKRDTSKILVVEKVTDLDSIEKTGLYKGLYHVLGGAINPLEGMTQDSLRFRELAKRADQLASKNKIELILATNPNASGETTALYLEGIFSGNPQITLTRLARGLASGSNLEYADESTLKHALEDRK